MRKLHDGIFVLENESDLNSDNVVNKLVNETDKPNENQELEVGNTTFAKRGCF